MPEGDAGGSPIGGSAAVDMYNALSGAAVALSGAEFCHPAQLSAVHLAVTLAPVAHQGAFVPEGGVEALCDMLRKTIEETGGRVLQGSHTVREIVIDSAYGKQEKEEKEELAARGVVLADSNKTEVKVVARKDVISTMGVLYTYKSLIGTASKIRLRDSAAKTPAARLTDPSPAVNPPAAFPELRLNDLAKSLASVSEAIPKLKCLFLISAKSFGELSPYKNKKRFLECDYIEVPFNNAALGQSPTESSVDEYSEMCWKVWSPSARHDMYVISPKQIFIFLVYSLSLKH